MNRSRSELISYFENMSLFVIGLFLLIFPLFFLSITTDAFVLPKQVILSFATGLFFIFFGLKTIMQGKLTLRVSPFDIPVTLFIVVFLSAILSKNRFDALIAFVPFLFMAFLYFGIVNIVKSSKQLLFLLSCLVLGSVATSILTIFGFFKIYLLPFSYTHTPSFTTFGSLLDQALYLAFVLPIAGYFAYNHFVSSRSAKQNASFFEGTRDTKKQSKALTFLFTVVASLTLIGGLAITVYYLLTTHKPLILPLEIGLQTGLAAISQDAGNIFKSFLLGSGIGTFLTDFTRFKAVTYNAYSDLWAFTFFRSSSFVLELLATTGILGLGAFLFLIFRVMKEKSFFLPLLLAIIAAFVLPFSFTPTLLLFILLAVFAVTRMYNNQERFSEMEFYFVAMKRKFANNEADSENHAPKKYGRFLSIIVSLLLLVIIGLPLYFVTKFFISDIVFQQSLVAASKNQGLQTYNLQIQAIKTFPYRDVYYRAFSQTNIALANSLVSQQKNGTPSAEVQKSVLTLIQQSINSGKSATTVAPLTAFNWNNSSSIYRSLIGFGQNADKFAILTSQQAIALDPANPQQYIELGGIYYQLGKYDDAIRQFQYALTLKRDYANAYYNLGHALEMKGDLEGALNAYDIVRRLVAKDPENTKKITAEIDALKDKIGREATASPSASVAPAEEKEPLSVNQPKSQLPERKPPVKIPGPTISPLPSPTSAVTPTSTE